MRDRRLELAGLAMILAAGGAVWLLRHPEAAIVERAAGWPLVGGPARALRARFLPPPPAAEPPASLVLQPGSGERVATGGASPGGPPLAPPPPAPEPSAPVTRRISSRDSLEPVGPLAARPADPHRLGRALAGLGAGAVRHDLGRYEVWTDVEHAPEILARWRPLVAASERAWSERYGVEPLGEPAETIVLFARQAAFLAYADETGVTARGATGITGWGIVALAAEGRVDGELDGSLQHELGHLLARRSLGPALPAWLAEGLAQDFGEAPLGADGRIDFDRVRGVVVREHNRFEIRGGLAALDRAGRRAARGAPPALAPLAGFDGAELAGGETGPDLYADAFVWIRFLLADAESAHGFRRFLAEVRTGGEPTLAALDRRLPRSLGELGVALPPWLLELRRRELAAHGAPVGLPDAHGVVYGETVTTLPDG